MSAQGTCKFFNDEKGFGFISPADGSEDVFVHRTNCSSGQPQEGDTLYYDQEWDDRKSKYRAINCTGGTGQEGSGKGGGGKGGGGDRFSPYGGGGGKGGGGKGACRQFQAGNCSYGDNCKFSHD